MKQQNRDGLKTFLGDNQASLSIPVRCLRTETINAFTLIQLPMKKHAKYVSLTQNMALQQATYFATDQSSAEDYIKQFDSDHLFIERCIKQLDLDHLFTERCIKQLDSDHLFTERCSKQFATGYLFTERWSVAKFSTGHQSGKGVLKFIYN